MMNWLVTEPATWTERYESLRRYVLEGSAMLESQPLGLVLWMANGMAGWMSQWSKLSQPESPSPGTACRPQCPCKAHWQAELTILLAQMTLPHLGSPLANYDS